jgi:predicted RNA methylase
MTPRVEQPTADGEPLPLVEDPLGGQARPATDRELLVQRLLVRLLTDSQIPPDRIARDVPLPVADVSRRPVSVDLVVLPVGSPIGSTGCPPVEQVIVVRPGVGSGDPRRGVGLLAGLLEGGGCAADAAGLWTNGRHSTCLRRSPTSDEVAGVLEELAGLPGWAGPLVWPARPDEQQAVVAGAVAALRAPGPRPDRELLAVLVELAAAAAVDDRRAATGHHRRFFAAGLSGWPDAERHAADRLRALLAAAAADPELGGLAAGGHAAQLPDRTLVAAAAELAAVPLAATAGVALSAAYEAVTAAVAKHHRSQYFTAVGVAAALAALVDPQPGQRILDPACGSGRLLLACLDQLREHHPQASGCLAGIDLDPDLVGLAATSLQLSGAVGEVLAGNTLTGEPAAGTDPAAWARLTTDPADIIVANPPFGAELAVDDPAVLAHYELGHRLKPTAEGRWLPSARLLPWVPPEVLFLERCLAWLRPGGRLGIVLPGGVLSNPGWEPARAWLLERAKPLVVVELPVEAFLPTMGVASSLVVLERREHVTPDWAATERDRPVFMAIAERVGHDRRGKVLWRRTPEGDRAWAVDEIDLPAGGGGQRRRHRIPRPLVDDDLPQIVDAYHGFRATGRVPVIDQAGNGDLARPRSRGAA